MRRSRAPAMPTTDFSSNLSYDNENAKRWETFRYVRSDEIPAQRIETRIPRVRAQERNISNSSIRDYKIQRFESRFKAEVFVIRSLFRGDKFIIFLKKLVVIQFVSSLVK